MANKLGIRYHPITGEAYALHLSNGSWQDDSYAFHELKISNLVDGKATISYRVHIELDAFEFTPEPHANDPVNDAGRVNYDIIAGYLTPITEDHHKPAPSREPTQVEKDINTAFVAIGNIFPRVVKLEKALVPPIIFDGWVAEGRELRLYRGGTGGDVCIIGVHNGFGGLCPRRIEGQPLDSLERMLDIEVNGSVHQLHIFSYGDTGRLATAIAQNLPTQTLGTPRPESGAESG